MGGGLLQLVAYGAQDIYLTGDPQITFWKVTYRRYTNFSMESIEQTFSGNADFGNRVTCTISRSGDLAFRIYLQVTLPEINQQMANSSKVATIYDDESVEKQLNGVYARWLDFPGEQLISMVEVEIGGQRIERQYGDWMHIWNQLTLSPGQERNYYKMIGHTTQLTFLTDPAFAPVDGPCSTTAPTQVCAPRNALPETTLYIPLQFWFCCNPGLALPLIALQYHEVKINLDLRPISECLWAVSTLSCDGEYTASLTIAGMLDTYIPTGDVAKPMKVVTAYQQSLVAASLYVDYVFLDTDERRRMAQNPHEYLIEQVQFNGDESVGSSSNKITLNFNHPCKELIWVVQPDANVDYCSSFICGSVLNKILGAQPFNYTDGIDALPNAFHAFNGPNSTVAQPPPTTPPPSGVINNEGLFVNAGAQDAATTASWGQYGVSGAGVYYKNPNFGDSTYISSTVSDAGAFVLMDSSIDKHCWGENPVVTAKLQLNGQDRFSEREGSYFNLVQPYQHHTRGPDTGINVYSFALRPEEHQPSGTCNFSRIDDCVLNMVLSNATVGGTSTAKVRVYAINYNVLRIMSGMGGLAYSN